jgi:hypothetical protein
MTDSLDIRLDDRRRRLRFLEATSHIATASAFVLTILLVSTAHAQELNGVASHLFGTVGFAGTGLLAIGVITVAFGYLDRRLDRAPRVVFAGAAIVALVSVADFGANLWLMSEVGYPDSVYWAKYGIPTALVAVSGVVASSRHVLKRRFPIARSLREAPPNRRALLVVVFSILLASSIIGPIAGFGGLVDTEHDGVASAGHENGTFQKDGEYTGHGNDVDSVATDDGGFVYSASADNEVHKFKESDMSQVDIYTGHGNWVNTVIVGDNGNLYSGDNNGEVHKIDPSDMSQVSKYTGFSGQLQSIVMGPDGYLYAGDTGGELHKIDPSDMSVVTTWSNLNGTNIMAVDVGSSGSVFTVYDNIVSKHNKSDLSQTATYSGHSNNVLSLAVHEGFAYSGALGDVIHKVDTSDMSKSNEFNGGSSSNIYALIVGDDGFLYSGDQGGEVKRINKSDMAEKASYTGHSDFVNHVAFAPSGNVFSASSDTTVHKLDPGTSVGEPISGTVTDSSGDPIGGVTVSTDTGVSTTTASDGTYELKVSDTGTYDVTADGTDYTSETKSIDVPDGGTTADFQLAELAVSGTVVDQYGEPVSDVQVRGYALNTTGLSAQEAQEELTNISDLEPPTWQGEDEFDLEAASQDYETEYVTVNTCDQWNVNDVGGASGVSLNPPVVQHTSPSQRLCFSSWNPSDGGSLFGASTVNKEWPGRQTDSEIVIQRLDGEGSVVTNITLQQNGTKTTGYFSDTRWDGVGIGGVSAGTDHSYAARSLPPGFYVAYSTNADGEAPRTPFRVGTVDQLIDETVTTENGDVPQQAQDVQNHLNNDELRVLKAKTDANGNFQLDAPANYETIAIQSFGVKSENYSLSKNSDMSDVRALYEQKSFEGAVTMQTKPVIATVPSENTTVEVVTTEAPPWLAPGAQQNLTQALLDYLGNRTMSQLPSVVQERLKEMQNGELEELHKELRRLQESNDRFRQRYLEEVNEDGYTQPPSRDQMSRDQLENDIKRLENSISDLKSDIPLEDGQGDVSTSGNLTYEKPIPGGIDKEQVSVIAEFNNGSSDVINQSYYRIETDATSTSNTLVVEDYPLNGAAVAKITVRVVENESLVGEDPSVGYGVDEDTITNPAFGGTVPDISAIDLSTLEPGPDERVAVDVRAPSDSSFQSVKSVAVIAPNGSTIQTDTSGTHDASFRTVGEGRHTIRVTYTDDTGKTFVETIRILAKDTDRELPASVRAQSGISDDYAITGEGLKNGYVRQTASGTLQVGAVIPQDGEVPSTLHVFTQDHDFSGSSTEVRVQRGKDRESVRRHVTVDLNTRQVSDDAHVWRNDEAIDEAGSSPYGKVYRNHTDKTRIRFVTNEFGRATIRVENDPSWGERAAHWWSLNGVGVPFATVATMRRVMAPVSAVQGGVAA